MTATQKLAHKRLTLLQLAEKLGKVSRACRMHKVSRSQFYQYKRSFQEHGLDGLMDKPPIPGSHPNELPDDVKKRIIELSLANPACGQQRIADELSRQGVSVCPASVRNVWLKEGMETKYKRLLKLEDKASAEGFVLTEQQVRLIEKANPEFAERHVESDYPGQLLCQDTFYVGRLKGVGRIYLQAVIDCHSRYAWGRLYNSKLPLTAVQVLNNDVLPFFEKHEAKIVTVLSDNGREFCGRPDRHPYELFLQLEGIEHRTTKVRRPQSNGFVERLHRTLLDEHFRVKGRTKWYEGIDEMQKDLDDYLTSYNEKRPHQGRCMKGRTPFRAFTEGLPAKGDNSTDAKDAA